MALHFWLGDGMQLHVYHLMCLVAFEEFQVIATGDWER